MSQNNAQSLLHSMGVFRHYCGYSYLCEAARLAAENPERLHSVQKEIYFPIAEKFHTNIQNVEKDIRTVRDILMRNGGEKILAEITGYPQWSGRKPYPKELIGILAECMKKS